MALSQSTSVCGLNPVRSGEMEYWWAQPLSHDGSVYSLSRVRSVSGTQLMAAGCRLGLAETKALLRTGGDADVQNQLEGIVRNKAIYQKVVTAMAELGYSRTWRRAKLPVVQLHEHRHENEIHLFFGVSYDSHMKQSRAYVFTEFALQNDSVDMIEVDWKWIQTISVNLHLIRL